jgi:hypothetical protein
MKQNYFENLPSWSRGVISIVGVGAVAFIGYQIYSSIKNAKELERSLKSQKLADNELEDLKKKNILPTKSTTQFEIMSDKIIEAINDCGTDEKQIYAQFDKVKNQADILLFVDVFGLRKKVRCPFSDDPRESFFSSDTPPMSLSAMINSELDTTEIQTLNNKLATKGIKYKF